MLRKWSIIYIHTLSYIILANYFMFSVSLISCESVDCGPKNPLGTLHVGFSRDTFSHRFHLNTSIVPKWREWQLWYTTRAITMPIAFTHLFTSLKWHASYHIYWLAPTGWVSGTWITFCGLGIWVDMVKYTNPCTLLLPHSSLIGMIWKWIWCFLVD